MGELSNCAYCDQLFVKTTKAICPDCIKEEEKQFRTVYDFLRIRKNRQATIPQIVEETGVEEEVILQFVRENRLRPTQFPNLNYPCDKCGNPITKGNICDDCSSSFSAELKQQEEIDKIRERNTRTRTYFTRR
ncbi:TIGR03826 family flagellar region protein [Gracilibacillus sp. YIM 98692]|uniref:TIGR03826 family flagellar region protein n=1 Tax=Gracilibacillus sp. YIM 98692 TaxID=2663532 RepID=UPI0013D46FB8|nr:TIGR03826 family flagellar region protein [Gracilibacillus sp. YIM 98692]